MTIFKRQQQAMRYSKTWGDMESDDRRLAKALRQHEYDDREYWLDYLIDLQSGLFDEDIEIILKDKGNA